ncbi:hypothetical protein GCM10009743_65700 [Kribbella swartbergensis]
MLATAQPVSANTTGGVLYQAGTGEGIGYARAIRLQHSGSANGTLLATFERGHGAGSRLLIRRSMNDGADWSTIAEVADGMTGPGHPNVNMYQPFLFELPQQVGNYPAGTLLLTANVIGSDNSTNFQLWRSTDHGVTWTFASMYQYARNADVGGDDPGIWEPFLFVNDAGKLVSYFADERQGPTHSQMIVHIVSNDGGDTWSANPNGGFNYAPGLVRDVASTISSQRPGMPTVTRMGDGREVLAYELCAGPRGHCEVYIKRSTDGGHSWGTGPGDLGDFVVSTDNRYPGHSPYVVWSPAGGPNGQLMLTSMHVFYASTNGFAPENLESVFVNTNYGTPGHWSWMPAPMRVEDGSPTNCYVNYSPHLLPSVDGRSVRYTAPSDSLGSCAVRTAAASAGVLPYTAPFATGRDNGWKTYGGTWALLAGEYSETAGTAGGAKAVAGSTGWTDYTLRGEIRLASTAGSANAGFLVRTSNPGVGTDALNGYYLGVRASGIFLGRQNYNWTEVRSATAALSANTWYEVTVHARGANISASIRVPGSTSDLASFTYTATGTWPQTGMIGVRDYLTRASWRNITVTL